LHVTFLSDDIGRRELYVTGQRFLVVTGSAQALTRPFTAIVKWTKSHRSAHEVQHCRISASN